MPDVIAVIGKRWKLIFGLTLLATLLALVALLVVPRLYLGMTTALPVNSQLNDKSRLFNSNIQGLYAEIGSADELDKIEGTTKLDTLYIATAAQLGLAAHYGIDTAAVDAMEKTIKKLKKFTAIYRTGYGELQIKVWDRDNAMAAAISNSLMQNLNAIHQDLQNDNNRITLQKIKEQYEAVKVEFSAIAKKRIAFTTDTLPSSPREINLNSYVAAEDLRAQLQQYQTLMYQYELAIKIAPHVLTVVEYARPAATPDKPKVVETLLLTFFAALLFSFLLALLVQNRKSAL